MSSRWRAGVIVCALVLLSGCAMQGALAPRGVNASRIADVWWYMFWVGGAVYVAVMALLLAALFRRRRRNATGAARERTDRRFIIGGGIALPAIVLGSVFGWNFYTLNALPDGGDVVVDVVGHRYWWEISYPEPGFVTANEMYIPTDTDVLMRLTTDDVIHSFWIPQLAGKHDMVPGHPNEFTLRATEPGTYLGECAEFCGIQHAQMRFTVVAVPPAVYRTWLARMAAPADEPDTVAELVGYDTFLNFCAGCHAVRGTPADGQLGPPLTHFASRLTIGAGAAPNDRGHLGGWVVNSQTIKPGNLMPPVQVDAAELPALLTYLESLE